eukprot:CAMPEP_0119497256 /NCGR_PEP_ID=MMETSP1344-20130328/20350_1 /TAXON_ID=236787 /ORGANISM="Florenciella parvula, Strain CCMP2471" /LENGTH=249 /DNA_ID=CAMNT_0007533031 /DNA_START=51 /DNA_END=796 /DNA_ORIENTATION=-
MSSRRRAREAHANCEPGRSADPKVLLAGVSANMTRKRIVRVFVGVMLALVCQAAAIYVAVPIMAASGVRPISLFYTSPPLPRRPLLVVGAVGSGTTAMAADLRAISLNIAHEDNGWASGKDGAVAWMVRVPLQPLAPFPPLLAPLASSTTYLPPIAYHPTTPQRHDPTTSSIYQLPNAQPPPPLQLIVRHLNRTVSADLMERMCQHPAESGWLGLVLAGHSYWARTPEQFSRAWARDCQQVVARYVGCA